MCAQFDNRSIKARHEYLCNLDEVLNTLQPSTFVDEQLSHYKVSFLYKIECNLVEFFRNKTN